MSKSYANRIEMRDGAVMLYQKPGAKRGFWYYRIHVRGMHDITGAKVKYDERSTGETDLDEAKLVALDRHDDLKVRVRRKEPVKSLTFADLYELWWAYKKQKLNLNHITRGRQGKPDRIDWHEKQSKRYWLPYFGKHKLEEMTHALIEGYWAWRMAYWQNATKEERDDFPNHALTPSKKTLEMEQGSLGEIFAWGNSMKLFSFQPVIRNPYSRLGLPAARRPSFDPDQFTTLSEYLVRWCLGQGNNDSKAGARLNSRHRYHRQMLRLYVLFIAETGMRPGEVLKLRFRDIGEEITAEHQIRHLAVNVPADTKTGARKVIGDPELHAIVRDLKLLRLTMGAEKSTPQPDDWVFADQNGKQSKGFGKTLQTVLSDLNLLKDELGARRSAYSFRHFYAERKFAELGYNPRAYDLLCSNMGTSRQMLEKHYVRKGIIHDQEAMLGLTAKTAPIMKAKQDEKDKRRADRKQVVEQVKAAVNQPPGTNANSEGQRLAAARKLYQAFHEAISED
jgi:integrase